MGLSEKKRKDLINVARREARFATLAHKEAQGTAKTLQREKKAHMLASTKDSQWELKEDVMFAKIRAKKAKEAKSKLAK